MSVIGEVRDGFPRVVVSLLATSGSVDVAFILDTGLAGELAIPEPLAQRLGARRAGARDAVLADGPSVRCPFYELEVEWLGEERLVGILAMQAGSPLLGAEPLYDCHVDLDMKDGGEVLIEPA